MSRKSLAQQVKGDVRNHLGQHQQAMDQIRQTQALSREVRMLLAPKLDLAFLFHGLIVMPWLGIVYVVQRLIGTHPGGGITKASISDLIRFYGLVVGHIAEWAGFWIGLVFRWLLDELGNAVLYAGFMLLTVLGYLLGTFLLLTLIYFVLTH